MMNSFLIGTLGRYSFAFWGAWMIISIIIYFTYGEKSKPLRSCRSHPLAEALTMGWNEPNDAVLYCMYTHHEAFRDTHTLTHTQVICDNGICCTGLHHTQGEGAPIIEDCAPSAGELVMAETQPKVLVQEWGLEWQFVLSLGD